MSNLNAKTRGKLERLIDSHDPVRVTAVIEFLSKLDAVERMFAHDWMLDILREREAARDAEAAGA